MLPAIVFFGVAAFVGCLIRATTELRRRRAVRQPDVSDRALCQLQQASRISATAVVVSLAGLALAGLAWLVWPPTLPT